MQTFKPSFTKSNEDNVAVISVGRYTRSAESLQLSMVCGHPERCARLSRLRNALDIFSWYSDPTHLPASYKQMSEWNAPYFTRKAMTVGPYTVKVIEHVLKSREHEVQTYRLCMGILNFTKKYSKLALEDCCKTAVETNHISYSFIKNSIAAVADEIGTAGFNTKVNEERNKGAFIMNPHAGDIERLLSKSSMLAGKEAGNNEKE